LEIVGKQGCCSYKLAHLAVPYGGRQDARLEPKYIQTNKHLRCGSRAGLLGCAELLGETYC
jgi:hypothetical protein